MCHNERLMRGRMAIGVLAFVLLVGTAGPDAAASGPTAPDAAIGVADGPLVGVGVIEASGLDERVAFHVVSGQNANARLQSANPGGEAQTFILHGSAGGRVFRVRYLDHGADVTPQVTTSGYPISLDPGETDTLRLVVRAVLTSRTGQVGGFRFRVTNQADPTLVDVVRAQATVAPVTVAASSRNGVFRCVASFPSATLHPGYQTHVSMSLVNLTSKRQTLYGFGYLEFADRNGKELGQSLVPLFGPPPLPQKVPPHGSAPIFVWEARVRWGGLLQVTPQCEGVHMPAAPLHVSAPGAPSSDQAAVDAAVAVPNSPFQVCHPTADGQTHNGLFPAPDGRDIPPLHVKCWAELRHERGFDVVALNLVSPQGFPKYTLAEADAFPGGLPGRVNAVAARWGFVVTATDVRPYIALMQARALGTGKAYDYEWDDGKWVVSGGGPCGFLESAGAFFGTAFFLTFVNSCRRGGSSATPGAVAQQRTIDANGFLDRRPVAG